MKILTASQMREVDQLTTGRYGIPSLVLMENAGSSVVQEMERLWGTLQRERIVVLCGKGNNGGDGFVVARHLIMRGCQPEVFLFASLDELKGDAQTNYEILHKMNVTVNVVTEANCPAEHLDLLVSSWRGSIVVDGLLGTGIRLPVGGFLAAFIKRIATLPRLVAIDVPSGLESDSLKFEDRELIAPTAELTVTFTAPKPSHIFFPSAAFSRRWVVAPIGSPVELLYNPQYWLNGFSDVEARQVLGRLIRTPESHKGNYGHILVIGGSVGKSGAPCMAAQAALRSGAGLVTLAVPSPCLPIVASQSLEIMTEPLEPSDTGAISTKAFDDGHISSLLEGKDVLALGPGMGRHPETSEFVRRLLRETWQPVVLDADGINAFLGDTDLLKGQDRVLVLTPHPGEFARLLGISTRDLLVQRIELSRKFALDHGIHLILKGHRTLYATPSGQVHVNLSGNPGMATGGSGDVLTGLVAGFLGQALPDRAPVEEIVGLSVYLHGLAGDFARESYGERALIASDIIGHLHRAFAHLESAS
jgi:ADP-dependent NAD(P)H-hydrate dehydratase / NAD(P)H-hydrate epimerase